MNAPRPEGRRRMIIDGCARGCPDGECYCAEPSYGDQAYTGICPGCGGYEECYCDEE